MSANQEKETFQYLEQKVIKWAQDRGLDNPDLKVQQSLKLIEELGELTGGVLKGNKEVIKDSIGDMLVVLMILNRQYSVMLLWEHEIYIDDKFCVYKSLEMLAKYVHSLVLTSIGREDTSLDLYYLKEGTFPLLVYLKHISRRYSIEPIECLEHAYNTIKDRKGKMINGSWVKEEDLTENN